MNFFNRGETRTFKWNFGGNNTDVYANLVLVMINLILSPLDLVRSLGDYVRSCFEEERDSICKANLRPTFTMGEW